MTIQTNGDDCRESGAGETSREQFESWVRSKGLDIGNALLRVGPRKEMYYQARIQERWEAWQASRADIEIIMPPRVITAEIGPAVSLEKMMARLAVNGIKVKPDEQRNPPQT